LVPSFLTFFEQLPPERKWSIEGAGKNFDLAPREGRERSEHEIVSRADFHDRKHILLCLRAEEAVRIESLAVAKRVPPLDLDTRLSR